jgi:hypothetical protein
MARAAASAQRSFIVVNNRGPFSFADQAALDFISAKRLRPWILERPAQGIYPCLRLGLRFLSRWRREGFRSHHAFHLCHSPSPVATGSATGDSGVRSMTSPLLASGDEGAGFITSAWRIALLRRFRASSRAEPSVTILEIRMAAPPGASSLYRALCAGIVSCSALPKSPLDQSRGRSTRDPEPSTVPGIGEG